jgi:hypothetical protein
VNSLLSQLRASVTARRLLRGGWSFAADSNQAALEPTCLALLALRATEPRDAHILTETQRRDGGWGSFAGDEQSSGLTGLALLTLNMFEISGRARCGAMNWLLNHEGKEAHIPWRWIFRRRDTHVRFDPQKSGWPWQSGTCSWVVPTAFATLALRQAFPDRRPRRVVSRIQSGVEMLLERACPDGGWNAGNGIVYGCPISPHIDATAVALLALQGDSSPEIVRRSIAWLEDRAQFCDAPWSLAWSILALHVWRQRVEVLQRRLTRLAESDLPGDTATLADMVLALECSTSGNPFEVTR